MIFFLSLVLLCACTARAQDVQRIKYYNSSNTCDEGTDVIIQETLRDFGAFGGRCFPGSCSLTAQTQAENTITSLRSCEATMVAAPQAFRHDVYFGGSNCASGQLHTSNGYSTICYPGTRSGSAFGNSSRFACDAQGNIFDLVYFAEKCVPVNLAVCRRLSEGPLNECVPESFSNGFFSQRAFCPEPESLPALCYPATTSTAATTSAPTTPPGLIYDVNRDNNVDILDIVAVLDQWGEYLFSALLFSALLLSSRLSYLFFSLLFVSLMSPLLSLLSYLISSSLLLL